MNEPATYQITRHHGGIVLVKGEDRLYLSMDEMAGLYFMLGVFLQDEVMNQSQIKDKR